ncbi:PREDICTED: uncharacterized protein LOC109176606 [Ipomoea nil]|uniref:uncharacterized protein LOC109176606 n=1 Tax=Ipomoea nil TaxID=35883 RepID=UPI000901828D|nr:PREDICTED: uncharacterized protein LOC109176606 [Ipomoea nil]
MPTNSSERTVTTAAPPSATTSNILSTAHHFISIKLTTRNYLLWRTQLVPFQRGQRLLGFVDGETPCPSSTVDSIPAAGDSTSCGTTVVPMLNPAFEAWVQQDQSILSLLISSLTDEVMYLTVSRNISREVWQSITMTLGSSTRARCLNLLGQFQTLRQGNSSPAEFLGRAQLLIEDLSLASHLVSLEEQNLFVFRGFDRNTDKWLCHSWPRGIRSRSRNYPIFCRHKSSSLRMITRRRFPALVALPPQYFSHPLKPM